MKIVKISDIDGSTARAVVCDMCGVREDAPDTPDDWETNRRGDYHHCPDCKEMKQEMKGKQK